MSPSNSSNQSNCIQDCIEIRIKYARLRCLISLCSAKKKKVLTYKIDTKMSHENKPNFISIFQNSLLKTEKNIKKKLPIYFRVVFVSSQNIDPAKKVLSQKLPSLPFFGSFQLLFDLFRRFSRNYGEKPPDKCKESSVISVSWSDMC